ncbi:MAG TPA: ornithine cyclodeaminase family protein [Gemmatimonadaceae bacterium]|nr:ornithine cyclodeaminase family protein [Gemmatimonadaceae bacterium]
MLVLSQADVDRLLPMRDCIELMASTLASLARGEAVLPLRTVIRIPDSRDAFAVMPACLTAPRTIGAKIITVFPGNHGTALDSHQGAVLLFDPVNGSLAALLDATSITTIRTAAVSAVATRALARDDASTLAIIGAGVQGHAHLEAICAVRPIEALRVWSRNADHAKVLVGVGRERFHLDATVAPTAHDAVRDAQVVCTCTSAAEPVLAGEWLAPGTHVNAVGASTPNAREVDSALVAAARLYVDRRESALKEPGDILVPLQEKAITPEHIVAEIGELLVGRASGRRDAREITLFKSLGLAVEDLAAASHVYEQAVRAGAGTRVELGGARRAAH